MRHAMHDEYLREVALPNRGVVRGVRATRPDLKLVSVSGYPVAARRCVVPATWDLLLLSKQSVQLSFSLSAWTWKA